MGFIKIKISEGSCFKRRCEVAMGTVLGGFGKPPGDGFGSEIDLQRLFSEHNIYKTFLTQF